MDDFVILGIFFPTLFFLYAVFGISIGNLNFVLWKNNSKRPQKKLKIFLCGQIIPMSGVHDVEMIYEKDCVYKITFNLMITFYIITAFNTLLVIAGFIVVGFFDNLGLLLLIVCSAIVCSSYLVLFIVIAYYKRLAYKNK